VIPEYPCATSRALAIAFAGSIAGLLKLSLGWRRRPVPSRTCDEAIEGDKPSSSCYDWRAWRVNMTRPNFVQSGGHSTGTLQSMSRPSTVGLVVSSFFLQSVLIVFMKSPILVPCLPVPSPSNRNHGSTAQSVARRTQLPLSEDTRPLGPYCQQKF